MKEYKQNKKIMAHKATFGEHYNQNQTPKFTEAGYVLKSEQGKKTWVAAEFFESNFSTAPEKRK